MAGLETVVQMLRGLPLATTGDETYACTRKRLIAELQRLQGTEWASYVLAARHHHPRRGIFLTLSIAMNRERTLQVEFPDTYPFHAPEYQLAEKSIPCPMAIACVFTRLSVPADMRPLIVSFLYQTRVTMLKRYVHDHWLGRGEMERLAHVMQQWDHQLTSKQWVPSNTVAQHLVKISTFLDEIGLTFTTP